MDQNFSIEELIQNELEKVSHLPEQKRGEIEIMLRTVVFMDSVGMQKRNPEVVIDLVNKLRDYGIDIEVRK